MSNIRNEVKFGTDGWRGVISDNFTFKNVAIVAQAIAQWIIKDIKFSSAQAKKVAVGYDTRFLSKEYAEIVARVLAKNGITVLLSEEAIPTPALSYGVVEIKGVCGVMITASHNPGKFNGIKIKTSEGGGAGNDITNKIEAYLEKTPVKTDDLDVLLKSKKIAYHNYKTAYLTFMKNYVDLKRIKRAKFKVIQDVMHGSGGRILEEVLQGSSIRLELMRSEVNPSFAGKKPEPVAEYLEEIIARVKKDKFDLGLVLDGDADRIGAVAPGGEFINPQRILGLIILHLVRNHKRKGSVVKTICGTTMIDNICEDLGLLLHETPVGFKYVSDLMVSERVIAGGEEAGGIGVQDYIPERDGTLAGLLLIEMMVYEKKNLKQLLDDMEKKYGRYYYLRADVALGRKKFDMDKVKSIKTLLGKKVVDIKDYDGVKLICEDQSWLMFRPSGTEPLVRAYSEATTLKRSQQLIQYGEALLKK